MTDTERIRYWSLDALRSTHSGAHRRLEDPEAPRLRQLKALAESHREFSSPVSRLVKQIEAAAFGLGLTVGNS